jgi:serine/threonine protein kinase
MPQFEQVATEVCRSLQFQFLGYKAAGAYKETFHIKDAQGESFALKIFDPTKSRSERTDREIAAMALCAHDNLARLHSSGVFDYSGQSYLYLIEEFLSGGTLTARLRRSLMTRDELLALGHQLIPAIAQMAEKKIVHRDLKPENVMFRPDNITPVIVDFGLVRDLSQYSLTASGQSRGPGTAFYSAPEQLNNDTSMIDWRTDQFALGVLFSFCIFGFHPYSEPNDTQDDVVRKVGSKHVVSRRFANACSASNLKVLYKMVASWPVRRYTRPHELLNDWK